MSIVKKALEKIKPENRQFIAKSKALADQVQEVMREKGISKKELAEKLEKQPSEISKWLSGMHNPTLRTITTLEVLLGTDLIMTPNQAQSRYNKKEYIYMVVHPQQKDSIKTGEYTPATSKNPSRGFSQRKWVKIA